MDGVTALMRACEKGHIRVVEELLVNGAGMWCVGPTNDPKTPFMWAAHHGQLDIIRSVGRLFVVSQEPIKPTDL